MVPGPELRVVTLADIARAISQLRGYLLGGAFLGLTIALAAGLLMRPVYRATAVVMPVTSKELGGGGGAVAGLLSSIGGIGLGFGDSSKRDEALAVLKSREFAQSLIADEKLIPVLFYDEWDAVNEKWLETDPDQIPTEWDAWTYFNEEVRTVREDQDRGLVTIQVEWFDPAEAARWANLMVERANADLRARKLGQLEKSLEFLEAELAKAQLVELRAAIAKLMESQVNERMLVNVSPEYAFRVIDSAVAPDMDQPERPKKLLLGAVGVTAGALLGLGVGLALGYTRRESARVQTN